MQLYYAAASPFVRKCLVSAHELGLRDRIELLPAAAHPVNRDAALVARNPLGKIPTLLADPGNEHGAVVYDSRVICEYLNALGDGHLLPATGDARWAALTLQALADGIMDAAVLTRYETAVRPEVLRWSAWIDGQLAKVHSGLAEIERQAPGFGARVDLGTIAVACALGYLDFRFASLEWRERQTKTAAWFDAFAQRESMLATAPPAA
jgi:glutathione S-transferase